MKQPKKPPCHELSRTAGTASDQQSLCRSCGICCQGLLFEYAEFDPAERHPDWPDELIAVASEQSFPLPCRAHVASNCSIYATRPVVCRNYQCRLLGELIEGIVTLDEARRVVERTRNIAADFFDALAGEMAVDSSLGLSTLFENFRSAAGEALGNQESRDFQKKHKKILLSHARLVFELEARFR
ncbi:MAG: hypothetical protein O3B72_13145 [Proteobacteria bacterium]|nr:hypothetical protein [Pseudomonadota bacterium]